LSRRPISSWGDLASEEDRLHAFVLEGESSKKSFPDFEHALLLSDGVGVEDGDGIGELGPKIGKATVHRVLE
jgi:hypothetical protein